MIGGTTYVVATIASDIPLAHVDDRY
jgi:hypothetical protein